MKFSYFCTTWGQKHENWNEFFQKVRDAGYDGVETGLPPEHEEKEFFDGLAKFELLFIAQHWETVSPDFESHKLEYSERLRSLAKLNPLFINSHTGRDHFSFQQNLVLLNCASRISDGTGVSIYHETHRGRFAFAAHIAKAFLEHSHPELTLDVSHWCCVAESLLDDQSEAVNLAIDQTRHLHARVGFEHGPQVFDFTLPQYSAALQFHLECWDKVILNRKKSGSSMFTITPEFGPPPYMQIVSNDDAKDYQWKLNIDMMNMLKERYR